MGGRRCRTRHRREEAKVVLVKSKSNFPNRGLLQWFYTPSFCVCKCVYSDSLAQRRETPGWTRQILFYFQHKTRETTSSLFILSVFLSFCLSLSLSVSLSAPHPIRKNPSAQGAICGLSLIHSTAMAPYSFSFVLSYKHK